VKHGLDVSVICVADPPRRWESPDGYSITEIWPGPASKHPVWAVRVAANLARMWRQHRTMVRLARAASADVYHCMNVDTLLQGWLASRRRGVYIYDSREHFASMRAPSPWAHRWWILKEHLLVPRAALVATVSDQIADDLRSRYGIARPVVVYNGPTEVLRSSSAPHRPLRVVHSGKFFRDRNLTELVDAVIALDGEAELRLLGWGYAEEELRRYVAERGGGRLVRFLPPVAPDAVVKAIGECDVGVLNIRADTLSHKWAAPNKLFDYMAAGLAQVVPDLEFVSTTVTANRCGIVMNGEGAASITDALAFLAGHSEELIRMKANAIDAAKRFSWDAQESTVAAAYSRAIQDARGARASR
jgi:glycosyltransferase involved in cell wall biosynthesis